MDGVNIVKNRLIHILDAIADSYRLTKGGYFDLSLFYSCMITQPYFIEESEMYRRSYKNDEEYAQWLIECCSSPFFVYAPIRSTRQQLQRGRYILFPNRIVDLNEKKAFATIIDPISKEDECIAKRIIIPKEDKSSILEDLKLFGISQETLFSDNLDLVCKSILNQFSLKMLY